MRTTARLFITALVVALSALALTITLLALPAAAAALPPGYAWAWPEPFVWQPPPGATETVAHFALLARGPAGSVYASTEICSSRWAVARIATADGRVVWSTPASEGPHGAEATVYGLTSDGGRNAIAAGFESYGRGRLLVLKLSPAGKILWQKTWSGAAHRGAMARAVTADARGNIYVAGATDVGDGDIDAVVLKLGPGGTIKWRYVVRTSGMDEFSAIALDGRGGVYALGAVNGQCSSAGEIATLKLDALGHRVWQRRVGAVGVRYSAEHLRVRGGGVYVAGLLQSPEAHAVVVKYSLAGRRLWAYGHSQDAPVLGAGGMDVDAAGRVVYTLNAYDLIAPGTLRIAAEVLVLTPEGGLLRRGLVEGTVVPGVPEEAVVTDTVVDAAGRIYCAGAIELADDSYKASVTSFPPAAAQIWAADRFWSYQGTTGAFYDRFHGLLALRAGEVYAAGQRSRPGSTPGETEPIVERLGTTPEE